MGFPFQLLKQVKFLWTTGLLHLLFPYLNFFFLQMMIWVAPCHHSRLNSSTTCWITPCFIAPFKVFLWCVPATFYFLHSTCHLLIHFFLLFLSTMEMKTAWEQRPCQVHNCFPSAWNSAQDLIGVPSVFVEWGWMGCTERLRLICTHYWYYV